MDKQIITFSANEQNLVRIGGEYHYSSNKVSYIGAHFDLGANWDGFDSVRAVWFTDRINGISTVLDGEGNCTVPTEVLKKKDRVFVNLVGSIVSNGELTDRLTTYPAVALVVDSKAKVDSTETAPVTPSQFEQFVSIVQDAVANIKDIVSTTLNADYTLTFVYSDGTSYTTPSIRGERGPQGADGADGTDGNGIASAVLNSNYTLTLTFTDGTSYTTPSIRGAQGPKGDPGDVSQAQLDAAVSDLSLQNNVNEKRIEELYSIQQDEQEYITSGDSISTNFDDTISGGYYNSSGQWVASDGWRSLIIDGGICDYELYIEDSGFGGVLFMSIYNGTPSASTIKGFYSSTSNTLPNQNNPLSVPAGYVVVFSNTTTSGFKAMANNVVSLSASGFLDELNSDLSERVTEQENVTDDIAPLSTTATKKTIGIADYTYFGNKVPFSDGTFSDNASYAAYIHEFEESGKFYMPTTGNSSYVFIALYNGHPSQGGIVGVLYRGSTPNGMGKIDVVAGQYVCVSLYITGTLSFNTYLDYYARLSLFRHDMKIAWFGDSISQLQQLPERVGNYMANTVYNCSFAGAPLSYGTEQYNGLSVRSLSAQIASGNFTDMDAAIDASEAAGIDVTRKRATANIIKGLDFSTDITDVVIMAGTNDLNNDYVTTSSDLTAFRQAVQTIITNFNNAFPAIRLYFITDPYRGDITPSNPDRHGHSLIDINEIIQEVCFANNISFYDLYHSSGINANTMGYFLDNDHLHQTEAGDILLSEKCAKWLDAN